MLLVYIHHITPREAKTDIPLNSSLRSKPDYYRVCYDEEELETIEHLLCNSLAFSRLKLKTLGKGFFEAFNSVS